MDIGTIIHCTDLGIWAVCDASFGTHVDGKGHTGFFLALGERRSYVHGRSGKQKIGSTSSTDAEVLAMVEALKMAMWLRELLWELQVTKLQQIEIL